MWRPWRRLLSSFAAVSSSRLAHQDCLSTCRLPHVASTRLPVDVSSNGHTLEKGRCTLTLIIVAQQKCCTTNKLPWGTGRRSRDSKTTVVDVEARRQDRLTTASARAGRVCSAHQLAYRLVNLGSTSLATMPMARRIATVSDSQSLSTASKQLNSSGKWQCCIGSGAQDTWRCGPCLRSSMSAGSV